MGCFCGKETFYIESYRVLVGARIAEGGFSYVDLCRDTTSKREFALKRIVCHSTEEEQAAKREADYHRQLSTTGPDGGPHPNLLVLEASTLIATRDEARSIISEMLLLFPLYPRGTLAQLLEIQKTIKEHLSEVRVLSLAQGICSGVQALHSAQPLPLAHWDIKTANVLLATDWTPCLMDFGSMAPARCQINNSNEAMRLQDFAAEKCTMPWRAPELFNVPSECVIDEKVDMWSLGCVVYALCWWESPFDQVYTRGDSIALAVQNGCPELPTTGNYSSELHQLIEALLKREASDRLGIDTVIQRIDALLNCAENRV